MFNKGDFVSVKKEIYISVLTSKDIVSIEIPCNALGELKGVLESNPYQKNDIHLVSFPVGSINLHISIEQNNLVLQ